jgi:hypothetical protein
LKAWITTGKLHPRIGWWESVQESFFESWMLSGEDFPLKSIESRKYSEKYWLVSPS